MKIYQNKLNSHIIAIKLLKENKIIVYPTDTCYGIVGCYSLENQRKINKIKKRDLNMKIPVLYSNEKQLFFLSTKQKETLKKYAKPFYTIILNDCEIGLRKVSSDDFYLKTIIDIVGLLLASSLNITSQNNINNFKEFQDCNLKEINNCFFFNKYISRKPSSIILVNESKIIKIIR